MVATMAKSQVSWSWSKGSDFSQPSRGTSPSSSGGGSSDDQPVNAHRNPLAWSKQMLVDECIEQLQAVASSVHQLRPICLHTFDKGTTQHMNAEDGILFLQEVLKERRAVKGRSNMTASVRAGPRRKEREITLFSVDVPDVMRDIEKEKSDREAAKEAAAPAKASAPPVVQDAAPDVVGAAAPVDEDAADLVVPCQLEAVALERARRLMEVQAVLDAAQPQEFVGLSIDVHDKRGTIAEYVDGKFKVRFDSGGEVVLAEITAAHLADTLPSWA